MTLKHNDDLSRSTNRPAPGPTLSPEPAEGRFRLMEVCGTHTVSIFRSGIRSVLPETISLLSGPGCPVCVTAQGEIDAFIALAREPEVIVATFGDLIRVPGSDSSLQREKAAGADIRIVYSTFDALESPARTRTSRWFFWGSVSKPPPPPWRPRFWPRHQEKLDNFSVLFGPQNRAAGPGGPG